MLRASAMTKYTPYLRTMQIIILGLCTGLLCSCSKTIQDGPPLASINVSQIKNPTPHHLTKSRYANPPSYVVLGTRYRVLKSAAGYDRRGIASWYGTKFHGKLTSTGETYSIYAMTAANKELPLPCYARVTNLNNHRQVIVKINDRGPFVKDRIIDLSYVAAKKLGMLGHGTARVEVKTITDFSHKKAKHLAHHQLHHSSSNHRRHPHKTTHTKQYSIKTKKIAGHHTAAAPTNANYHQIGAFYNHNNALKAYRSAQKQGKKARLRTSYLHKKILYRVSVKNMRSANG